MQFITHILKAVSCRPRHIASKNYSSGHTPGEAFGFLRVCNWVYSWHTLNVMGGGLKNKNMFMRCSSWRLGISESHVVGYSNLYKPTRKKVEGGMCGCGCVCVHSNVDISISICVNSAGSTFPQVNSSFISFLNAQKMKPNTKSTCFCLQDGLQRSMWLAILTFLPLGVLNHLFNH